MKIVWPEMEAGAYWVFRIRSRTARPPNIKPGREGNRAALHLWGVAIPLGSEWCQKTCRAFGACHRWCDLSSHRSLGSDASISSIFVPSAQGINQSFADAQLTTKEWKRLHFKYIHVHLRTSSQLLDNLSLWSLLLILPQIVCLSSLPVCVCLNSPGEAYTRREPRKPSVFWPQTYSEILNPNS